MVGGQVKDLDTPAVLVDDQRLQANIETMAAFARKHSVALRPHIKTHKCVEIAQRQLDAGAVGITCAKLGEAETMAASGIGDILIAYPLVGSVKLRRLLALATRCKVSTVVDSLEGASALSRACAEVRLTMDVLIKVNTGLNRCGVLPGDETLNLSRQVAGMPGLRLKGILTHAGHAYGATVPEERERIGRYEGEAMVETARLLATRGLAPEIISVGSTPTVHLSGSVPGVTEIRPGNYVFYDRTQVALGVATSEQCALSVLTRVVSIAPGRVVIDAGSKVLSLDRGAHGVGAVTGYGHVRDRREIVVERLSEEHGVLHVPPGEPPMRIGDVIEISPNHACAVVNNVDFIWIRSGSQVVARWGVAARGQVT